MDAEPPNIVFEIPAPCADGHRAQRLLEQSLGHARAPAGGWAVSMHVETRGAGVLHAEGEIRDEHGAPVGHRVLDRKTADCSGLARAMGVWASLVLDTELHRPRSVARAADAAAAPSEGNRQGAEGNPASPSGDIRPASTDSDTQTTPVWPPRPDDDKLDAERDAAGRPDEGHSIEIGAGSFLMTGTGAGIVAGITPFALFEAARNLFIRPAIVFGGSLPSSGPDITIATTRTDGCLRIAGLYTSRNGMQLDFCGGLDLGVIKGTAILPYVAVGPSADLRGELGGDLAAMLRGLFDMNAVQVHGDSLDTPLWAGRVELAMSWRLR